MLKRERPRTARRRNVARVAGRADLMTDLRQGYQWFPRKICVHGWIGRPRNRLRDQDTKKVQRLRVSRQCGVLSARDVHFREADTYLLCAALHAHHGGGAGHGVRRLSLVVAPARRVPDQPIITGTTPEANICVWVGQSVSWSVGQSVATAARR